MKSYKYEVAFSFCKEDESLASQLNDLIQERYSTFIYYERQKELAGRDGENKFKKVFRDEARVVVVLYSEDWGNTSWTRIESDAIRERAYDDGYNFTLFIPTQDNIKMPDWFPRQRLWYGIERYGFEGAASVIESKIQENFGEIRKETAEDRARRLQNKILFETQKKRFLNSLKGVKAAKDELSILFSSINDIGVNSTNRESGLIFMVHSKDNYCNFFNNDYCVQIKWESAYRDSLDGSYLFVELTKPMRNPHNPIIYSTIEYTFDMNQANSYGWISKENKFYKSKALADYLFKILLDKIEKEL